MARLSTLLFLGGFLFFAWLGYYLAPNELTAKRNTSNVSSTPLPERLQRFFTADEVDKALAEAKIMQNLWSTSEYETAIRFTLTHSWNSDGLAIYNLLIHSYMIPADIRFSVLQRALQEVQREIEGTAPERNYNAYQYSIAGAIGLAFTPEQHLQRIPQTDELFKALTFYYASNPLLPDHSEAKTLRKLSTLAYLRRARFPADIVNVVPLLSEADVDNVFAWFLTHCAYPLSADNFLSLISQVNSYRATYIEQHQANATAYIPIADTKEFTEQFATAVPTVPEGTTHMPLADELLAELKPLLYKTAEHYKLKATGKRSKLSEMQSISVPDFSPAVFSW